MLDSQVAGQYIMTGNETVDKEAEYTHEGQSLQG